MCFEHSDLNQTNPASAMLNRDSRRPAPPARHAVPGLPSDPMLRHGYGGQLESAAEAFLVQAFERSGSPLGEGGIQPVLVSAAMHILNRSAWTQPSDEQVKAAMFLSQQAKGAKLYSKDDRRAA